MTDRQLLKATRQFRDGILEGRSSDRMCFMVCFALQGFLSACGLETLLIEAEFRDTNHVWLQLPDGRVLDPTADQFGLAPVYLGQIEVLLDQFPPLVQVSDGQ